MLRSLLILCATSLLLSACVSTRQMTAAEVRSSAIADSPLLLPLDSPSEADIQLLQVDMQPQNLDTQKDVASPAEVVSDHNTKFAIYFGGAVILAALVLLLLTGSD